MSPPRLLAKKSGLSTDSPTALTAAKCTVASMRNQGKKRLHRRAIEHVCPLELQSEAPQGSQALGREWRAAAEIVDADGVESRSRQRDTGVQTVVTGCAGQLRPGTGFSPE